MKKIVTALIIFFIATVLLFVGGAGSKGAPSLAYVYSDSMEPLIQVNDAFIVWPASRLKAGDIVMYRPSVLDAPFITHRIIAVGASGFITKGDNSPSSDQDSGEPEVTAMNLVGEVVQINGSPLLIRGLGYFSSGIQKALGKSGRSLAGILLVLGLIFAFTGKSKRKPKSKNRLRMRDVYRLIAVIAAGVLVFSIYIGSRVTQVKYLVSVDPGTIGNQVKVGEPGQLEMKLKNNGLSPVWSIAEGIAPIQADSEPKFLWPISEEKVVFHVPPKKTTGYYLGYIRVYHYPALMPGNWILFLHRTDPVLAMAVTGIALWIWLSVLILLLGRIPGMEGWVPLKSYRSKLSDRRMNRLQRKVFGKRMATMQKGR